MIIAPLRDSAVNDKATAISIIGHDRVHDPLLVRSECAPFSSMPATPASPIAPIMIAHVHAVDVQCLGDKHRSEEHRAELRGDREEIENGEPPHDAARQHFRAHVSVSTCAAAARSSSSFASQPAVVRRRATTSLPTDDR